MFDDEVMVEIACERGLPRPAAQVWWELVQEWDRALRVANRAVGTRYGYELAVTQFAEFLASADRAGSSRATRARTAAGDVVDSPLAVEAAQVEQFIAWMVQTRSAGTAVAKFKGLQQFFNYLCDEGEIPVHPMAGMQPPAVDAAVAPGLSEVQLGVLLATCRGTSFLDRRDTALIWLLVDTNLRPSQVTTLPTQAVDLHHDALILTGDTTGVDAAHRALPISAQTSQALHRYLQVRVQHRAAHLPELFLSERGIRALHTNAIQTMLRRRGHTAAIPHLHTYRLHRTQT